MKSLILFTLLAISASKYVACGTTPLTQHSGETLTSLSPCNPALWARTYGPMERFSLSTDRSTFPHQCVVNVRGKLTRPPLDMRDGDVKIWLQINESNFQNTGTPPPPFVNLTRGYFFPDGINRVIIAEVVCAAKKEKLPSGPYQGLLSPVKDPANLNAIRACRGYQDTIFDREHMLVTGNEIYVTGELVTDTGPCDSMSEPCHGHVEIHPVTEIKR